MALVLTTVYFKNQDQDPTQYQRDYGLLLKSNELDLYSIDVGH